MNGNPICVTIGEPAGIGPDIIIRAWHDRKNLALPDFFVIGDEECLLTRSRGMGLEIDTRIIENPNEPTVSDDKLPLLSIACAFSASIGKPHAGDAAGIIEAIKTAVNLCLEGSVGAMVTCPINKKALYDTGFDHPGHTEFLAELCSQATGKQCVAVMMLAGPDLKTIPVTVHIPLTDVASKLTTELIVETAKIATRDLQERFDIKTPRLAIAGLNPHAGEQGAMGDEDFAVITPAVEALRQQGIEAIGPLPADTMFHHRARQQYDVALCMYHDQALIPAKTLAFDDAVNVTLGLPIIRTSPDHGTAFDIAGTGKADPRSFIAALKLAHQMAKGSQQKPGVIS